MKSTEDRYGDVGKHWMVTAERDGRALPVTVVAKWRWYKKHAGEQRIRHYVTELVTLISSAAIPVAAAAHLNSTIIAAIGAVVLIATGVRTTFGLHENRIEQSQIGYPIEREAALFVNSSPPYDGVDAVQLLVERVDTLAEEDGQRWARRRRSTACTHWSAERWRDRNTGWRGTGLAQGRRRRQHGHVWQVLSI